MAISCVLPCTHRLSSFMAVLSCLQVTPQRLQRKRARIALKRERHEKTKADAQAYNELLAKRHKEQSEARHAKVTARRSSRRASEAVHKAAATDAPASTKPASTAAPKSQLNPSAAVAAPAPKAAKATQPTVVKAAAADSTATSATAPKAGKAAKAAKPKAAQAKKE